MLLDTDQSVLCAGGYIVQLLPGAGPEVIEAVEAGVLRLGAITTAMESGLGPREVLERVLEGFELELLESSPVEYRCYCSRDRMERALVSLGRTELEDILREQGQAELTCQFCDNVYRFSGEDLEKLLEKE
ncbi:33 kDa chaperonin [bioreactor metagenome]|uniref:33 kDa chaperonin n=1 Tax=bioreactor metagenome TaxID=1076179 RepID=A0A645IW33_9ZZZZ